jgi:hypothetical protein
MNAVPTGPRLSVDLLDSLVENLPVGVLVVDAGLRVVRTNAALCRLVGGDEAVLAGRPLADVAPWIPETDVRRVLASGAPDELELSLGRLGRFAVGLQPLTGGEGTVLACLVRDVGELVAWRRGMGGIEELAADLSGALTQADVTRVVVGRARELVGAATVGAALLSDDGETLEVAGMAGFDEATEREWRRFDLGRPTPMGDAVRTGLAVFLESADERAARYPDLPGVAVGEAVAALPIPGQGGVIGAISFRFGDGRRLGAADRSALLTIAQH